MKRFLMNLGAVLALAVALTGCGTSSFSKAVEENTKRQEFYLDAFLEQAANDLTAINDCWLNAKKGNGESAGCMVMSTALRLTNSMLFAFLAKPEMTRVPAAPEEIVKDIAEKGMQFSLMKHGIDAVSKVVNTGQAASYQLAVESMRKNPIVVTPSVITGTEQGFGVLQPGGATTVNP